MAFKSQINRGIEVLKPVFAIRLAALSLVGIAIAGCETMQPQFSASFNNPEYSGQQNQAALTLSLELPVVSPTLSEPADTSLLLRPSNPELLETPSEPRATGDAPRSAPGDVLPRIVRPEKPLQCVPFARAQSGIEIRGNANNWWGLAAGRYNRTKRPEEGSVFVMKGYRSAQRGHVAVVRRVIDDRTIIVDHANWGNDGRIHLQAPIRDLSPKNDWSEVQVWYTPSNQWGQRVYTGKGFILPTTSFAAAGASGATGSN
jgi:hypothetical protein